MAMKQGDILDLIHKNARSGTLLSSCEPEVHELMRHIDALITGKETEWVQKWAMLETKLREKEKELAIVKHALWKKDEEIETIKQQHEEEFQKSVTKTAQSGVESLQLKAELRRMTEKYEHLKSKHKKYPENRMSVPVRKCANEIHQLREQNQVLEKKRFQYERERHAMEGEVKLAKMEIVALEEKCLALEGEMKFCHSQLDQRGSLVAAIEQSSAVRVKQLESQLKRTQEVADAKETSLQNLHAENGKWRRKLESAANESQSLGLMLTQTHTTAKDFEAKLAEVTLQLKKTKEQLKSTENQLFLRERDLKLLQDSIHKKDQLIKFLRSQRGQGSGSSQLQEELSHTHSQLQSQLQHEKRLREEMATLKQQLAESRQEFARMSADFATKEQRLTEQIALLQSRQLSEVKELQSWPREDIKSPLNTRNSECQSYLSKADHNLSVLEDRLKALENLNRGTGVKISLPPGTLSRSSPSPRSQVMRSLTLNLSSPNSDVIQHFLHETEKMTAGSLQSERTEQPTSQGLLPLPSPHTTRDQVDTSAELLSQISQPTEENQNTETAISARNDSSSRTALGSGKIRSSQLVTRNDGSLRTVIEGGGKRLSSQLVGGKAADCSSPDDMFTVTLDNIVDRHFQQLDLSLKRMMSQHSSQDV